MLTPILIANRVGADYSGCVVKINDGRKIIASNRKARHDFEIKSTLEVGIELMGSEVKSLRNGRANLADAYAIVEKGQVYLRNLHISPYKMATHNPHDPLRVRRLLLHKKEIRKLLTQTEQKGMALVPLSIYISGKLIKIELALAVGRRKYDKRQVIAKNEADRKMRDATRKDL